MARVHAPTQKVKQPRPLRGGRQMCSVRDPTPTAAAMTKGRRRGAGSAGSRQQLRRRRCSVGVGEAKGAGAAAALHEEGHEEGEAAEAEAGGGGGGGGSSSEGSPALPPAGSPPPALATHVRGCHPIASVAEHCAARDATGQRPSSAAARPRLAHDGTYTGGQREGAV